MKNIIFAVLLTIQTGCTATMNSETAASPYAGEQMRTIKALSADEIAKYRAGEGMGYAKAAELNHYPGPKHVLALAGDLHLTEVQRGQVQRAFDEMQPAAIALGERIVEKEAELDALFADNRADDESVRDALRAIGALQADLRFVHLNAHLAIRSVLSDAQVAHYDELRGYTNTQGTEHDHSKMDH